MSIPDKDVIQTNMGAAFTRTVRALGECELTERVLIARSERKRTGRWPATIDASSAIEDAHWIWEPSPPAIRLSRELIWSNQVGMKIPLRYELR